MQLIKRNNVLVIFLAVMAIMTVISRAADSFMVPQVEVGSFEEMELKYPVEIEGRVGTKGKQAIYCMENLRIENVWVQKNDIVQKGDLLFTIDMGDLSTKIGQTEQEIRKIDLQISDIENINKEQTLIVTADEAEAEGANTGAAKNNEAALLQMEKKNLQSFLQQLYDLQREEGRICSEFEGRILECTISAGSITLPEPVIILEDFTQPFQFEGVADENTNLYVEEGIACTLEMNHGDTVLEGIKISKVAEGEEGTYRVVAELDSDSVRQTGKAVLSFTKESCRYAKCIPLSALYSGSSGYYVMAVKEEETILGMQWGAEYVPVTLLESNEEYAAVEGDVSKNEQIIVYASKTIKEGDRVRILTKE